MRRSVFLVLCALAVALAVIAAALVVQRVNETRADLSGHAMLPDFAASMAKVERFTIVSADHRFTLQRGADDRWSIPEMSGYAVVRGKVIKLLHALSTVLAIEPKTQKPERHGFLGVEAIAPGTPGRRVTALAADQTVLADLIIGKPSDSLGARRIPRHFVRFPDDPQVWLGEADFDVSGDPVDWLVRDLFSVVPERIQSASVIRGAEEHNDLTRPAPDQPFTMNGLVDGKEIVRSETADSLIGALTGVTFDAVIPAADLAGTPPLYTLRFQTFDGLALDLQVYDHDKAPWVTIGAAADPALAAANAGVKPALAPGGKPLFQPLDAVKSDAAAIQDRVAGWAYRLDNKRMAALLPLRTELIAPDPGPKTPLPHGLTPEMMVPEGTIPDYLPRAEPTAPGR